MQLFRKTDKRISLEKVNLGLSSVSIPIAHINGDKPGATLLVTAGNDGDEYAGIEACYRIIEEFSQRKFRGALIIIPIVNIPGFEKETSNNPLDELFPKHIYPGKENGRPSERLRYWLSGFIRQSNFWLDLHGGSLTERVNPYVHTWKSHDEKTDEFVFSLLQHMPVTCAVVSDVPHMARDLSAFGCGYLMCESGAFGLRDESAVRRHVDWVHATMNESGMIDEQPVKMNKHIFTKLAEYHLNRAGVWRETFPKDNIITKGSILGVVTSVDGKVLETLKAKENGVLLWGKEGLSAHVGDTVAGVGFDPIANESV